MLVALSAAEIAMRVTAPWALAGTVDYVFAGQTPPAWLSAPTNTVAQLTGSSPRVALLLGIGSLGLVAHLTHQAVMWCHSRLYAVLAQRLTADLRTDLFSHLQCLALAEHVKMPAADAVYRLSADATCVEQLVFRAAIPALASALTLIAMFSVLVGIHPWLAVISLAVVPGLWLSLRIHARRVRGEAARIRELESRAFAHAQESLSMIRLVKTFAREAHERDRFSAATSRASGQRVALNRQEAGFSFTVGALTSVGTTLVLVAGGAMVIEGAISAGTLLLVLTYVGFVYGPLTAISHASAIVREALASTDRVRAVFEIAPEPVFAVSRATPRVRGHVCFDAVSFAYSADHPVLHDVTFEIEAGEFVAIVGPSGGGKTTITSLLTRLYEPSRGRIVIDGIDASAYALRHLREQIAMVGQDAVLLSGSVRDNLRYGRLTASDEEIGQAARDAYAHEFIERLPDGYETNLGTAGARLSGGQRQRISIARAFLKNAPILVLDEPTSALDTLSERRFVHALDRLRHGRTTIVIAHRLSTVRRADRIFVIGDGRLVAVGTHEELIASNALYARLAGEFADDDVDVPPRAARQYRDRLLA
jgi:ABC-type multidrug transport system fused ATPase/permease subunit